MYTLTEVHMYSTLHQQCLHQIGSQADSLIAGTLPDLSVKLLLKSMLLSRAKMFALVSWCNLDSQEEILGYFNSLSSQR